MSDSERERGDGLAAAWIFFRGSVTEIPERWRERAVPLWLLPLSPDESDALLEESRVTLTLPPPDAQIARLLAEGLAVDAIAKRLELSPRTVHRRLAALREQFGTASTVELALLLAKRGF